MKWTTSKESKLTLTPDVDVEIAYVDHSIGHVEISVAGKPALLIHMSGYCLTVSTPTPPVFVKRWRLTFKLGGAEHTSLHVERYEAEDAAQQLDSGVERMIDQVEVPAPEGTA